MVTSWPLLWVITTKTRGLLNNWTLHKIEIHTTTHTYPTTVIVEDNTCRRFVMASNRRHMTANLSAPVKHSFVGTNRIAFISLWNTVCEFDVTWRTPYNWSMSPLWQKMTAIACSKNFKKLFKLHICFILCSRKRRFKYFWKYIKTDYW